MCNNRKKIYLQNLCYWNVDLQEIYFHQEVNERFKEKNNIIISTYYESKSTGKGFL